MAITRRDQYHFVLDSGYRLTRLPEYGIDKGPDGRVTVFLRCDYGMFDIEPTDQYHLDLIQDWCKSEQGAWCIENVIGGIHIERHQVMLVYQ